MLWSTVAFFVKRKARRPCLFFQKKKNRCTVRRSNHVVCSPVISAVLVQHAPAYITPPGICRPSVSQEAAAWTLWPVAEETHELKVDQKNFFSLFSERWTHRQGEKERERMREWADASLTLEERSAAKQESELIIFSSLPAGSYQLLIKCTTCVVCVCVMVGMTWRWIRRRATAGFKWPSGRRDTEALSHGAFSHIFTCLFICAPRSRIVM